MAENMNTQGKSDKRIKATRTILSKRTLFGIKEDKFIVSNLFTNDYQPVFAENASPIIERQEQWRRIVTAGVDQRMCEIFDSKEDADEYYRSLLDRTSGSIDLETGVRYRFVKLSREMFSTLSEGMSVVSCSFYLNGRPRFYEETSPKSERGEQWEKIVKAGFGRIKCFVFYNQADMQDFFGHRGFKTAQAA